MNIQQEARDFLHAIYVLEADGSTQDKEKLLYALKRWEKPLERLLKEAYSTGMVESVSPEVLQAVEEISAEENDGYHDTDNHCRPRSRETHGIIVSR